VLPFAASADCVDVPNVVAELPKENVTPNGVKLTFSYDIERSEYSVAVSHGSESYFYSGLRLQMNCHPAQLRWESDDFVLLERGCGTFCWNVDALGTTLQRRFLISRPIAFDAARALVLSYPEWDTIGVLNLATGHQQTIETARHCESSAEVCFDAYPKGNALIYVWQDGAEFSVPLDERLFR
jgi:hypothetical protein